jgi:hypothetical protein
VPCASRSDLAHTWSGAASRMPGSRHSRTGGVPGFGEERVQVDKFKGLQGDRERGLGVDSLGTFKLDRNC